MGVIKIIDKAVVRHNFRNKARAISTGIDEGDNWPKTRKWAADISDFPSEKTLTRFAIMGVNALYEQTPKRTGKTAASWSYEITRDRDGVAIYWRNNNLVWQGDEKVSVAVLIQNGHATPRGNWVEGRDFIGPALKPVIKKLNKALDKEAEGR